MKCPRVVVICGMLILTVFFAMVLSLTAKEPASAANKSKPAANQNQAYVAPSDPALYAGVDTCKTCHEDKFKSYEESRHYATAIGGKGGPQWEGCEACHGPGKAHVEGGGDKSKIFAFHDAGGKEMSQRCLACHAANEEQGNFQRSAHWKSEVGCVDCHSVHKPGVEKGLLKKPQTALCYECHLAVKPDFAKPVHHRVNEGLVECSDCHNPHGGFGERQVRSSASHDAVCFKCHSGKAGPFAVEHAVMRTEGCSACHSPHGSSNPRLLKRSQVNLLCLECHTNSAGNTAPALPSFHNQAQKYQSCTLCHIAIHGSNSDRFLMRP
jgi:DmsE family decaheme c-type cytochrome